jgi:hypothetical protein
MAQKSNKNWQEKLEKMEAEIYEATPLNPPNNPEKSVIPMISNWFSSLPTGGKVIIAVFGTMLAFSLINTVFSLVKSLLTIAILGGVLYFIYRVVVKQKNTES